MTDIRVVSRLHGMYWGHEPEGLPLACVSFIIPTNRSDERLVPCLEAIDAMQFDAKDIEVVVVFNGTGSIAPVSQSPGGRRWRFQLVTDHIEEANISAAKNRALNRSTGQWIFLINDDTLVEPDFVSAHLRAHEALDRPAMVLGQSRWKRYEDETVFDRMITTTSMVFFYDRMAPHQWYNFRHAWNLNLSVHRRFIESVRFEDRLKPVNFDDLEWAYRVERTHGLGVWYEPAAVNRHDHRYTLDGYLSRENHLGHMAVLLWELNPACFEAIFGSPLDREFVTYCRRFVALEGRREPELLERLTAVATQPGSALAVPGETQERRLG